MNSHFEYYSGNFRIINIFNMIFFEVACLLGGVGAGYIYVPGRSHRREISQIFRGREIIASSPLSPSSAKSLENLHIGLIRSRS